MLHDRFLRRGTFGWDLLIQRYSVAPRQRIGLAPVSIQVGQPAEFFVFDPNAETVITREYLRTRSPPVSPFLGETLTGAMRGKPAMLDSWFC